MLIREKLKLVLGPLAIMMLGVAMIIFVIMNPPAAKAAENYRPGPYAGLSVGVSSDQVSAEGLDLAAQGASLGGVVGWTIPISSYIVGLEGNVGWNGVHGSWGPAGAQVTSDGSWYAGIRARAGIPIGPVLLFTMVGPSFQEISLSANGVGDTKMLLGLAAGAGVDLQLTNTIVIRLAGEHTWWRDTKFDLGNPVLLDTGKEDSRFYGAVLINLN